MNYRIACCILQLPEIFNEKTLRKHYYIQALKYHPDRNISMDESKESFQNILEAYNYLLDEHFKLHMENSENSENSENQGEKEMTYFKILECFFNCIINKNSISPSELNKFTQILNLKLHDLSDEILNCFSKSLLIKMDSFMRNYPDVLKMNGSVLNRIKEIIKNHLKNVKIIVVNPNLDNLFDDDLYRLEFQNEDYYIPFWHHELIYELSNNQLIVQCEPILPEYMEMDENNNLHFSISLKIGEIMQLDSIDINLGKRNFVIPVNKLLIRKTQTYHIKNMGISKINTKSIYDVSQKSDILINIIFTDMG